VCAARWTTACAVWRWARRRAPALRGGGGGFRVSFRVSFNVSFSVTTSCAAWRWAHRRSPAPGIGLGSTGVQLRSLWGVRLRGERVHARAYRCARGVGTALKGRPPGGPKRLVSSQRPQSPPRPPLTVRGSPNRSKVHPPPAGSYTHSGPGSDCASGKSPIDHQILLQCSLFPCCCRLGVGMGVLRVLWCNVGSMGGKNVPALRGARTQ
jgi:hypothetical protein